MGFTSDIFFKHQFALIIQKLFLKNQYLYNQITQEIVFEGHFLSFVAFGIFCMS